MAAGLLQRRALRHHPHHPHSPTRLAGYLVILCGLAIYGWQAFVSNSYAQLAQRANVYREAIVADPSWKAQETTQTEQGHSDVYDWNELRSENADIAAWVRVDGTEVDLPVVSSQVKGGSYYLRHDFWQRWALEGTPFLDHRCQADDVHRMVFGHHLATQGQFSELQKAFEQERFSSLGPCHWSTPSRGTVILHPLLALCVEKDYAPIQRFDMSGEASLRDWLQELVADADARAPNWQDLVARAQSAVTLVTCSSDLINQKWRTLVIFVEC